MGEQLFLRRLESTLPVISIWVSMMCNLIRNLAILLKEVFIPYSLSLLLPCSHILFHSTTFSSLSFTTIGSRAHLFTGFFLPSGASFGPSPFTEIPTSFKRLCACRPARWDLMLWNSWSIWRLAVFSVWRNTRGIFGGIVTYPTKERFQETQVIEKGLFFFFKLPPHPEFLEKHQGVHKQYRGLTADSPWYVFRVLSTPKSATKKSSVQRVLVV